MPHRNLLSLCFAVVAAITCWAARDHSRHGRLLGDVLERVEASYIRPVDSEELFEAAVKGLLGTLDEHSGYVPPEERAGVEAALDQAFGGVGLEFSAGPVEEHPVVRVVRPESPAMRAGFAPGDRILSVDGRSTRGLALSETIGMLRGRVGTRVNVSVLGPGSDSSLAEVRSVELRRETLLIESVLGDRRGPEGRWDFRLEGRPSTGFLRITSFGERTADEVAAAIAMLTADPSERAPLDGLVIDLRGNPGGLLSAAVEVCDLFVGDRRTVSADGAPEAAEPGVIVSTRGRAGRSGRGLLERRLASAGDLVPGVPLAVLVDGGTSSAAEIVAACLQDHGRATIVGGRSFGKGTVQQLLPLPSGGLLKLTTSQYFRPSGRPIHRPGRDGLAAPDGRITPWNESSDWGVVPDPGCAIEPSHEASLVLAAWRQRRDAMAPDATTSGAAVDSAADLPERVDPVLARAIEAIGSDR
jgi:carboxyl-terminal processing protease